ncbi:MAG: DUF3891 family protein [Solirubrobacterales bacterium]
MPVSSRAPGWTLVGHADHGVLAGELATHWGNAAFAAPTMSEALEIAARHHDDGWRELDDLPLHDAAADRPAHFLEVPLERSVPPYGRGVDSIYDRDPLAGVLADMHWTGLYSARWGLAAGAGPVPHPLAAQVVAERDERRLAALREAWAFAGPRSEFEADTWHAYEVLQALDLISLALSVVDPARPTSADTEPVPLPATLAAVEQPVAPRLLPAVPKAKLGERVDLRLDVPAPGVAAIAPWPFATERFAVELPARSLATGPQGEEEWARAYREAPVESIAWELVDGSAA